MYSQWLSFFYATSAFFAILESMNLRLGFLCFILASFIQVNAQISNEVLEDKILVNAKDSGLFGFSLLNTNYMRNTEYFNPIEEGRTLFGYQLQPKFTYQPSANIAIEAGVWLRHDFGGNNPYTTALPTFSVKATQGNMQLVFGTLQGSLSHGMLEPMMNINSIIDKRIENGFQFKYTPKKFYLETWINWENFIQPNEFNKERFTAGINSKVYLKKSEDESLNLYYQFMASHQGGQIDSDTIDPFMMQFNQALGIRYTRKMAPKFSVLLDAAYLNYTETSDSKVNPFTNGMGVFANAGITYSKTDFMFSYWNATNFIAPRGTYIYQSHSTVDSKNYEENRQLIFFRIIHNKPLFNSPITASARFEPVYDLNNGIFDFSYSLYLVYRGDWHFGKK
ncbi:MAG: hypothetical protein CFE21_05130 [Bacteroidetes bacterium B1(2017)]|nr:MAG: hypothetical protein CFE21_05130 [Bacteroidetes bacterium B1(2017)]